MQHSQGLDVSQETTAVGVVDAEAWRVVRELARPIPARSCCSSPGMRALKLVERYASGYAIRGDGAV